MPLLRVDGLVVRFGGVTALDGVSFTVGQGEVCGLIGPNGAGKTTLFNCVSRLVRPQEGRLELDGQNLLAQGTHQIATLGIARTFQHLGLIGSLTVRENVMLAGQHGAPPSFGAAVLRLPAVGGRERALRRRADEVLELLGLAHLASRPAAGLPYGTLKRIELARALGAFRPPAFRSGSSESATRRPRLLLLDEPASGLTHGEVEELSAAISAARAGSDLTVLLVEHHMGLVMSLSEKVVVLDFGRKIAEGTPESVRSDPAVLQAYLGVPA